MEVICIDASNKPNDIPNSQWVKKDTLYTALSICKSKITGDTYFKLKEIHPPPPYGGYNTQRFGIVVSSKDVSKEEVLDKIDTLEFEEIL